MKIRLVHNSKWILTITFIICYSPNGYPLPIFNDITQVKWFGLDHVISKQYISGVGFTSKIVSFYFTSIIFQLTCITFKNVMHIIEQDELIRSYLLNINIAIGSFFIYDFKCLL